MTSISLKAIGINLWNDDTEELFDPKGELRENQKYHSKKSYLFILKLFHIQ